jgi:AcrR family transcriptional regulator
MRTGPLRIVSDMARETITQGRPRDTSLSQRILDATMEVLARRGYPGLTIEGVAQAARCGKTAIYRRYPDKAHLAAAALAQYFHVGDQPDTGNVVDDLAAHAEQNLHNQATAHGKSMGAIVAGTIFEPEVYSVVAETFFGPRHQAGLDIVARGIKRGELPPDTDGDLMLDIISGLTIYRQTLQGTPISARNYRDLITRLVADPPRLDGDAPPSAA